mmetsp:Transcript_29361/g.68370  ORF Transcript_29361/g.68370 Transcript_29361/m.68370 type:complete len:90 (-) Transcript_29361:648-917(-)
MHRKSVHGAMCSFTASQLSWECSRQVRACVHFLQREQVIFCPWQCLSPPASQVPDSDRSEPEIVARHCQQAQLFLESFPEAETSTMSCP